jgi:hypothetical protein
LKNVTWKSLGFTLKLFCFALIFAQLFAGCGGPSNEDALNGIGGIWAACKVYHAQNDKWPASIGELANLKLEEKTQKRWTFRLESSQEGIRYIFATSTSEMPGGAGKTIRFDAKNGRFSGYGFE